MRIVCGAVAIAVDVADVVVAAAAVNVFIEIKALCCICYILICTIRNIYIKIVPYSLEITCDTHPCFDDSVTGH